MSTEPETTNIPKIKKQRKPRPKKVIEPVSGCQPLKYLYLSRLGNKQNDIKYFKYLLPMEIATVCEPFAGSFAILRMIYYDDRYHKVINDYDKVWIKIMITMRDRPDYLSSVLKNVPIYDPSIKLCIDRQRDFKHRYMEYAGTLEPYLSDFLIRMFNSTAIFRPKFHCNDFTEHSEFLKKCEIHDHDYMIELDRFHDDETAFVFCDPPYIDSNNINYIRAMRPDGVKVDNTRVYVNLSEYIKTCKCKFMLILNKNALMEYLFKGWIRGEYNRTYLVTKQNNTHIIITNYLQVGGTLPN
jgi:site-specific DNA-adenine methylase